MAKEKSICAFALPGTSVNKQQKENYNFLWIRLSLLGCALFVVLLLPMSEARKVSEVEGNVPLMPASPFESGSSGVQPVLEQTLVPSRRPLVSLLAHQANVSSCGLYCWLQNLTITVPNTSFPFLDVFVFQLAELTCKGVDLGGINSAYIPPLSLNMNPYGIGTNCTADWKVTNTIDKKYYLDGVVNVEIANTTYFNLTFLVSKESNGLASGIKVSSCNTKLNLGKISFEKDFSWILNGIKGPLKSFLESELRSVICSEFATLIQTNVTQLLQQVDTMMLPYIQQKNPPPPPAVPSGSVNFTENAIIGVVDYAVDTLLAPGGQLSLNSILKEITHTPSGIVRVPNVTLLAQELSSLIGEDVPTTFDIEAGTLGNITVGLQEVNISGLAEWKHFNLLDPISAYELASFTDLGELQINASFFVNVSVGSSGVVEDGTLYEQGTLNFAISNATLNLTMVAAFNESLLHRFEKNPTTQLIDLGCLTWAVSDVNFTYVHLNMTVQNLSIVSLSGEVEYDLDTLLDNTLLLALTSFNPAIPAFVSGLVQGPGRETVNTLVKPYIGFNDSCTDKVAREAAVFDVFWSSLAFSLAFFVWLVIVIVWLVYVSYYCIYRMVDARERGTGFGTSSLLGGSVNTPFKWGILNGVDSDSQEPEDSDQTAQWNKLIKGDLEYPEVEELVSRNLTSGPLLLHPSILWPIRLIVPFFTVVTIALFISSNTAVGATVYINVVLKDNTIALPSLFNFSLGNTVRDMWNAGVYPLSLLVAVFSGAWPYVKLLAMLACWVFPTCILRPKLREYILMTVDALGKWSLIDIYVMTLMLVAFHIEVASPEDPQVGVEKGAATVKAYVAPANGFYTFLAATVMSLIIGHIAVACHRHVMNSARRKQLRNVERKTKACALWGMSFRLLGVEAHMTKVGRLLVALLLLCSLVLTITGILLISFEFVFEGAAAVALQILNDPTAREYSVLTLGTHIAMSAEHPNFIGIRLIQATFFTFAIAMPVVFLVTAMVLWMVPLKPFMQRILFVITEIMNAWAALDVFVIALIAALLELTKFSEFIIGDRCDTINELIKQYVPADLLQVQKCFEVQTSLKHGCWILFAACVLYLFAGTLVIQICHNVLEDREERAAQLARKKRGVDLTQGGKEHKSILQKAKYNCGVVIVTALSFCWLVKRCNSETRSTDAAKTRDGVETFSIHEGDETSSEEEHILGNGASLERAGESLDALGVDM